MTTNDVAAITARMKAKGIDPVFVNMGVVKPGIDEAESRKIFEGAKRLGITVLVAEPETHDKNGRTRPGDGRGRETCQGIQHQGRHP
jgi:molybdenum cofactor biosynthesis enzyme MoaA